tara:strand:- start:590 stop:1300 length:711 start_codon:yes stop_codon:yes gene_type:complete
VIQVQNLCVQFNETPLFKDLNLTLEGGESVVIIGPSGSGKTVLLKVIAGLISPTFGEVKTDLSSLGMLFQKNALFDSLSVLDNLLFPLKEVKKEEGEIALQKAKKLLSQVGLEGTEKQFPHELSGGMQKRLGIARALIVDPEIILYDEPTAGLDPITSRIIADLMNHLNKTQGKTVLTVTNDVHRAYQLGDRIFLLADGELIGGGSAEEIKKTKNEKLRQFILGKTEGPLTPRLNA